MLIICECIVTALLPLSLSEKLKTEREKINDAKLDQTENK